VTVFKLKEPLKYYPTCKGTFINYPVFVDAKIDGEMAIYNSRTVFGKNMARKEIPLIDRLSDQAEELRTDTLYGELHVKSGHAGDLYKLKGAAEIDLRFTLFDFKSDKTLMERREDLMNCPYPYLSLQPVPFEYATNVSELNDAFYRFTEKGYEGVVIKSCNSKLFLGNNQWVKIKKKYTADLKVISVDKNHERVGLGLRPFTKELCGCKVQGTYEERLKLAGKIIEIEYLQKLVNDKGVLTGLRSPIFKRIRDDKTETSLY